MDSFDERILSALRRAGSASFDWLVAEAGVSHNTVRLHLHRLVARGIVVKEKTPSKKRGRPSFTYSLSPKVNRQQLSAFTETVTLNFSKLRHLCRVRKRRILQTNKKAVRSTKMH